MGKLKYRIREISPNDVTLIVYDDEKYKNSEKVLLEDVHLVSVVEALRFIGTYYPDSSEDWHDG